MTSALLFVLSNFLWNTSEFELPNNLRQVIGNYDRQCFLIKDLQIERVLISNDRECKVGELPASTFKIPNALIGLETGVIKNKDSVFTWDGRHYTIKEWEKDHSLQSAIKVSSVPYFQVLARRVGLSQMRAQVRAMKYGNRRVGEIVDEFWLKGPLRINAFQQIEFLEALYKKSLPAKEENLKTLQEILVYKQKDGFTLSGKTGSLQEGQYPYLGWYVGHLKTPAAAPAEPEANEAPAAHEYVFATRIVGDGAKGPVARDISIGILTAMKLLPKNFME